MSAKSLGSVGIDCVGVGVGETVGAKEVVGAGVGIGVGVAVGVGEIIGFGAATLTATPLFQTSLLPDLTQVYFLPPVVDVAPALVHLAPAFAAANEGVTISEMLRRRTRSNRVCFMEI